MINNFFDFQKKKKKKLKLNIFLKNDWLILNIKQNLFKISIF